MNLNREVRKVSDTGGEKGQKIERHDLVSEAFLEQLALVCGIGAEKYDDENWRKGYPWGLSYGALRRHLRAFWTGEDLDDESGLPHLAHAAWHCMVLWVYSTQEGYGRFDTRPDLPELSHLRKAVQLELDIEDVREEFGPFASKIGECYFGRYPQK